MAPIKMIVLTVAALVVVARSLRRQLLCRKRQLVPGSAVLITGASGGLGRELALYCSREGCALLLVGRDASRLEETAVQCRAAGAVFAHVIQADLSTDAGPEHVAQQVAALESAQTQPQSYKFNGVKYLILNAGIGAILPFTSDADFMKTCRELMDINYFANVRLLQLFLSQLTRNHSTESPSRIIVISSLAGILPSTLRSPYTASKHALQGFMNALRGEVSVPITVYCPGYIDTDFHQNVRTDTGPTAAIIHARRGHSAASCAAECMHGALCDDAEVMSLEGRLGYCLRPFLTSLIDYLAKRKSLNSLKK